MSDHAAFKRERDEAENKELAKRLKDTYHKGKPSEDESLPTGNIIAQFCTEDGQVMGPQLDIPLDTTTEQLHQLINHLLKNDELLPYTFYIEDSEVLTDLAHNIKGQETLNLERTVKIVYVPQALFRVRAVTRCTGTLSGHTEAVLHTSFSPNGTLLASGSGDTTVRIWDVLTQTPKHICKGHKHWIQCTAWSPDSKWVASGSADGDLRIWDTNSGNCYRRLKGHQADIRSLTWQPMHRDMDCRLLASAGKDTCVRIWDIYQGKCLRILSSHTQPINGILWGGEGLLYSVSSDTYIKVWDPEKGIMVRDMKHAHRVNTISVHTESVLRTGGFEHTPETLSVQSEPSKEKDFAKAVEKYQQVKGNGYERVVTGSDDNTLYLWQPAASSKPIERMVGHQQVVNQVRFSPDGRYIASASFDKTVRLWDGITGKFIATLRGHVQRVYMVSFSSDSRLVLSASADSTVKLWDIHTHKLKCDLPGHEDEVYAVDWSPDGAAVASGSKDKTLKIWHH